uniref:Uncharacterized protein n=1 Tax=Picea sitchensis TaxID=3332 RepID=A9NWG5_PICSI|nr:unknown [Picea sitchensis]
MNNVMFSRVIGMGKAGDIAFKTFTGVLGVTSIYLGFNFAVNLYNGISWHNAQTKLQKEEARDRDI